MPAGTWENEVKKKTYIQMTIIKLVCWGVSHINILQMG